jgi:hypothetical protein
MRERKNTAISFRASARFKEALTMAAKQENRSQSNLLETLLYEFCRERGIAIPPESDNFKK